MATLALRKATIFADGRTLETIFDVQPTPSNSGMPDWRPGEALGKSMTISGGRTFTFQGCTVGSFNNVAPHISHYPGTSILPEGRYYFFIVFKNGSTVTSVSVAGGDFESHAHDNGSWGTVVDAGDEVAIFIPDGVPIGHTMDVYRSTSDGDYSTVRLLKSGIASGTTKWIVDSAGFENASQVLPDILGWVASWWLVPGDGDEIERGESITVTCEAGILEDEFANTTASVTGGAVTNYSYMGGDGWSDQTFERGTNGRDFVFHPTLGDDATGLGTAASPWATLAKIDTLSGTLKDAAQGGGSRFLLARGQEFPGTMLKLKLWGQDRDHPAIIEDYWNGDWGADPGTRPRIVQGTSGKGTIQQTNLGRIPDFVIIRRIEIGTNQDLAQPSAGLNAQSGAVDWMLDDVRFAHCGRAMQFDGSQKSSFGAHSHRLTIHKCIVYSSLQGPTGTAESQGIHTLHLRRFVVSLSHWDTNGNPNNTRCHGMYLGPQTHFVYFSSVASQTSPNGAMGARGGSHALYCMTNDNVSGGYTGRLGGWVRRAISIRNKFGYSGVRGQPEDGSLVHEESLCIEATMASGGGANFASYGSAGGPDDIQAARSRYALVRNCTMVNAGPWRLNYNVPEVVKGEKNIFVNKPGSLATKLISFTSTESLVGDFSWLEWDDNVYYTTDSQPVGGITGTTTIAQWRTLSGADAASLEQDVDFVTPNYDLDDYAASISQTDEATLRALWNTRPAGTWSNAYEVWRLWSAFKSAYKPTNLADIGSGDYNYYGFSDYGDIVIGYTISGPSEGTTDEELDFTVTPSATSSETVAIAVSNGTRTPTTLTWTGDTATKAFSATPDASGTLTITLTVLGVTVATKQVTITDIGINYSFSGATSTTLGSSIVLTLTPSAEGSETIDLSTEGSVGGAFLPDQLIWTGDAVEKTTEFTPENSGINIIIARRAGELVAQYQISIATLEGELRMYFVEGGVILREVQV